VETYTVDGESFFVRVMSADTTISTAAGDFHCMTYRQENPDLEPIEHYYICQGIGIVRRTGYLFFQLDTTFTKIDFVEELTEYHIQ
jgi:hypothetical protein